MSKPADVAAKLRAFADAHPSRGGMQCSTCNLAPDVLDAIRSERKRGTPYTVIVEGLKTMGIITNDKRLGQHFRSHEQRQG